MIPAATRSAARARHVRGNQPMARRLDGGQVAILGQDTTRAAAHHTARLGVGRTFQTPRVFDELSIWDNLLVGADFGRGRGGDRAMLAALAPHQGRWRAERPDELPHAQRRLLEVLRVIATDADLLLYVNLVRFDVVAGPLGRLTLRRLVDYPNLWGFLRDIYQRDGIADTVHIDFIKAHYYRSHPTVNPSRIVPIGPEIDYWEPHGREKIGA